MTFSPVLLYAPLPVRITALLVVIDYCQLPFDLILNEASQRETRQRD